MPIRIGCRTSLEARNTTASTLRGLPAATFSFSRRKTFSTSTMASSTSAPMATAMPPSVIVLIETSKIEKTMAVMASDSGIAVSVMTVVRKFRRKRKSTITTRMEPSRTASSTLSPRDR